MPKVPGSGAVSRLGIPALPSPAAAAAPGQAAARALEPIRRDLAQRDEESAKRRERELLVEQEKTRKRRQSTQFNQAESDFVSVLNTTNTEFLNRTDFESYPDEHDAAVEEVIETQAAQIADPEVREAFVASATRMSQRQSRQFRVQAAGQESENIAVVRGSLKDQFAAQFGLAPDNASRSEVISDFMDMMIEAKEQGTISESDFTKEVDEWNQDIAGAYIRRLKNENPTEALRQLADPNHGILKVLPGDEREFMEESIRTELRLGVTEARLQRREAEDRAVNAATNKVVAGEMTPDEIIRDTTIPGSSKPGLITLARNVAEGRDVNAPDWDKINALESRVSATIRGEDTLTVANIWDQVGHGIPVDRGIAAEERLRRGPTLSREERIVEDTMDILLASTMTAITRPDLGPVHPILKQRAAEWSIHVRAKVRNAQAEGADPMAGMLLPGSSDYIVREIDPFRMTQMERLKLFEVDAEEDLFPLIEIPKTRQREPAETTEAFEAAELVGPLDKLKAPRPPPAVREFSNEDPRSAFERGLGLEEPIELPSADEVLGKVLRLEGVEPLDPAAEFEKITGKTPGKFLKGLLAGDDE